MTLVLSDHDIARLTALQEELLSPLDHDSIAAWGASVLHRAEALFRGDRSAMLVPLPGNELHYMSESIAPELAAKFKEVLAPPDPGALRFKSAPEDVAWGARRAQRLEVWNIPMLSTLMGRPLDVLPAYHEYILPSGITHGPVATTALPSGEAFLGVANADRDDARFNGAAGLGLMQLVLPAFKAGVHIIERVGKQRAALLSALDSLNAALVVCDVKGRVLHETRQAAALLTADPEQYHVRVEVRAVTEALVRLRYGHRQPVAVPLGLREITTARGRYRLSASYAGRGVFGLDEAILVHIEASGLRLPTVAQLVTAHGLTRREADVALCLARGFSNTAIAEHLGLSRHTVRHHAEAVFLKLNIHSRKALALTLLSGPHRP